MHLQPFRIDVDNAGHMIDLLRVRFDIVRKSTQSYYRYFSEITSAATLNTVIWKRTAIMVRYKPFTFNLYCHHHHLKSIKAI